MQTVKTFAENKEFEEMLSEWISPLNRPDRTQTET